MGWPTALWLATGGPAGARPDAPRGSGPPLGGAAGCGVGSGTGGALPDFGTNGVSPVDSADGSAAETASPGGAPRRLRPAHDGSAGVSGSPRRGPSSGSRLGVHPAGVSSSGGAACRPAGGSAGRPEGSRRRPAGPAAGGSGAPPPDRSSGHRGGGGATSSEPRSSGAIETRCSLAVRRSASQPSSSPLTCGADSRSARPRPHRRILPRTSRRSSGPSSGRSGPRDLTDVPSRQASCHFRRYDR